MARHIAATVINQDILVCEAGTGTGKTFAYLIPALLSGCKTIISTGTKNLQDQLFYKDLPIIRDVLQLPINIALLKGRANYLCRYRTEMFHQDINFLNKENAALFAIVSQWINVTTDGDLDGLADIPEKTSILPMITSTTDNCLNNECPYYEKCYLVKARRRALKADLLVINHHLFFADMLLKEEGFSQLLPQAESIIIDEAHQLPEIANQFFGLSFSSRQLLLLTKDCENEYYQEAEDTAALKQYSIAMKDALSLMQKSLTTKENRSTWHNTMQNPTLPTSIERVKTCIKDLAALLKPLSIRSKGLENCYQRCVELVEKFAYLTDVTPDDQIHWVEVFARSFRIHHTPMQIAKQFNELLAQRPCAWVFTSATLTVNDNFNHYLQQLGLNKTNTLLLNSPFDYIQQAMLYIPKLMPHPQSQEYTKSVVNAALPVLQASQGRAFFLFTSHRALHYAAHLLATKIPYPLLVQGEKPKKVLLDIFRDTNNAILMATASFWEGVDVRGDSLSCVIIDKLPFASPTDPILQARLMAIKKQGDNSFYNYQLPHAVINLKQGAGRLIRDIHDRGVLMLCDPRVLNSHYGKIFIKNLPPMKIQRNIEKVKEFYSIKNKIN